MSKIALKSRTYTEISLKTRAALGFTDITDMIQDFVAESMVTEGLVNIQSRHTTAAIVVNENEPLLISDMKKHLERLASHKDNYRHDDFTIRTVNMCSGECANGHSHCKALHLPTAVTLNVQDGALVLGRWQRIFLLELDRPRPRQVSLQIVGN